MLQGLDDERGRDVVREVGDELRRGRSKLADVDVERVVPERDATFERPSRRIPKHGLERAVELDRVDDAHAIGEVAGEDSEPRADLEDDVGRVEGRSAGR